MKQLSESERNGRADCTPSRRRRHTGAGRSKHLDAGHAEAVGTRSSRHTCAPGKCRGRCQTSAITRSSPVNSMVSPPVRGRGLPRACGADENTTARCGSRTCRRLRVRSGHRGRVVNGLGLRRHARPGVARRRPRAGGEPRYPAGLRRLVGPRRGGVRGAMRCSRSRRPLRGGEHRLRVTATVAPVAFDGLSRGSGLPDRAVPDALRPADQYGALREGGRRAYGQVGTAFEQLAHVAVAARTLGAAQPQGVGACPADRGLGVVVTDDLHTTSLTGAVGPRAGRPASASPTWHTYMPDHAAGPSAIAGRKALPWRVSNRPTAAWAGAETLVE